MKHCRIGRAAVLILILLLAGCGSQAAVGPAETPGAPAAPAGKASQPIEIALAADGVPSAGKSLTLTASYECLLGGKGCETVWTLPEEVTLLAGSLSEPVGFVKAYEERESSITVLLPDRLDAEVVFAVSFSPNAHYRAAEASSFRLTVGGPAMKADAGNVEKIHADGTKSIDTPGIIRK